MCTILKQYIAIIHRHQINSLEEILALSSLVKGVPPVRKVARIHVHIKSTKVTGIEV
jgi:hypothetical protein